MSILSLIVENKKERIIDRFRNQLESLSDESIKHAEKIIDQDPSATKKYSEWGIKKFITIGKNVASLNHTAENIIEVIKNYHNVVDRLSKEKVENMMDQDESEAIFYSEDSKNKVLRSPKDINSFGTVYELQKFLNSYDRFQFLLDQEEKSKKESEKLYEDDRFLIVRPLSHTSSCYYGAGTKWCTTERDKDEYFNRYTSRGKLYYVIDKKSNNRIYGKMALLVPHGKGTPEIYNQRDDMESMNFFLNRFEPIRDKITEIIEDYDDYGTLLKVSKSPSNSLYESLNSKYFDRFDGDNAMFYFNQNIHDFLSFFKDDIGEDSISYYHMMYENPGRDFFYDMGRFDDDMDEGYPLYSLTDEHIQTLKSIIQILQPDLMSSFDGNQIKTDELSNVSKFIKEKTPKLYEEFQELYSPVEDDSHHKSFVEYMEDEVCNIYDGIGLTKVKSFPCYTQYTIPVKKLLEYYNEDLEFNKKLPVEQVLENKVLNELDLDAYPYEKEFYDGKYFSENFNDEMQSILEDTLDEIEDDNDVMSDSTEYKRIFNYIEKKFGFNKKYPIKSSEEEIKISFDGVDPKTNKINFTLTQSNGDTKKGSGKLPTIVKLLNNYTLFNPF